MDNCLPHVRKYGPDSARGAAAHVVDYARSGAEGQRLLTDLPSAEAGEQLGGYTLIELKELDDAVEIAAGFLGV